MAEAEVRSPNSVDLHVGGRVRLRRKLIGISQEQLAVGLGLTFQQVQKYERGTNRVSASKLYAIARELGVTVAFFFDGLAAPEKDDLGAELRTRSEELVMDFLATPEGLELAQLFPQIKQGVVRRRVLDLVKALIEDGEET